MSIALGREGCSTFSRPLLVAINNYFHRSGAAEAMEQEGLELSRAEGDQIASIMSKKVKDACHSLTSWASRPVVLPGVRKEILELRMGLERWSNPADYMREIGSPDMEDMVSQFLAFLAKCSKSSVTCYEVGEKSLDDVLLLLIAHRVASHEIALANKKGSGELSLVQKCHLSDVAQDAVRDCTQFCIEKNGAAPEVELQPRGQLRSLEEMPPIVCMPSHAYYILVELVKNAMQSHINRYTSVCVEDSPPIQLSIAYEESGWTRLLVEDFGIGMTEQQLEEAAKYLTSSIQEEAEGDPDSCTYSGSFGATFHGLGMGVRMAKLHAQHSFFMGDVTLSSSGLQEVHTFDQLVQKWREQGHAAGEASVLDDMPRTVATAALFSFNSAHDAHKLL